MKRNEIWSAAVIILIFIALFFAPKGCPSNDHAIVVQGDGEVYATPDTVILSLRVEETKPTTKEAQKTVDEKVAQVKDILKAYSIPASDIKTTNVSTYESFDWKDSGRESLGYTSSHSLEIKIKNSTSENEGTAWKILSEISEIWGVLVNNVSYDIYDKAEYYSEARKLAMEKAYQKASELAELWGVRLWKPISIQENMSYDYAVWAIAMKNTSFSVMEDVVEEEADLSLGEMKISLDINVSYKIK